MANVADAFVTFHGDFSQVKKDAALQGKGLEKGFSSNFKNIAKGAAVSFAAIGGAKLLKGAFQQAEEAAKVARQTQAVIKSTGGDANVSAGHVENLATRLEKVAAVDDEIVQSAENVLLTFRNVKNQLGKGNNIFDQATEGALNMSAALHTDLQGNILQLGKALNDPVKGLTRLTRAGVTFTDAQQKQIKALAKSGDLLGAQKVILGELSKEFGGAAAAAATPSEKLKVAFQDLEESLGRVLVPLVNGFVPAMTFLASHPEAAAAVLALAAAFGAMVIVTTILEKLKAFKIAMVSLNVVLAANPIILVVAALAALGVGLFIAYKKVKPFHDAIDALWQLLQATFHWVQRNWPLLLAILTGPFGLAVRFIIQHWSGIVSFFKGVVSKIGGVFKNIATVITAPYRAAFNEIARLWNATIGKLSFKIPSWVPKIGGKGFDVPDIPTFATGGIASFSSGSGLALLHSGEGVFTPNQMNAMGNSRIDASIHIAGSVIDFDQLNDFADQRDRKLALVLRAG